MGRVAALLFFISGVSIAQGHVGTISTIFVDTTRGTLESTCWTGGEELPCNSLELALEGAKNTSSSVVIVKQCNVGRQKVDFEECSSWFTNNRTCECGNDLDGVVRCNSTLREVAILDCYCMTLDEDSGSVVAGACFYNCENQPKGTSQDIVYHRLPSNVSRLNKAMCGSLNRRGRLCGQCKDGYLPPVYSYDLTCRKCSPASYHWVIYILVAFVPLTVFLLIVLWFRISATSARLNAFVIVTVIFTIIF